MTGTTPLAYARWRGTALGAVTERLERAAVLDLAGPLAGRDVLDVGCGDGTYALAAARAGARVTGVDRLVAAIEAARRNAVEPARRSSSTSPTRERSPFRRGASTSCSA